MPWVLWVLISIWYFIESSFGTDATGTLTHLSYLTSSIYPIPNLKPSTCFETVPSSNHLIVGSFLSISTRNLSMLDWDESPRGRF